MVSSDTLGPVSGNEGDGVWYLFQEISEEKSTGNKDGGFVNNTRRENGGWIINGQDGTFSITIPLFCGEQTLKLGWQNTAGWYAVVIKMTTTECIDADIRVTLSWGEGANDLEMHLIREGGKINVAPDDCTWTNMNPDWGQEGVAEDNPKKDVDHTGDKGVENIFLSNPEDITYRVMVEYWASGVPTTARLVILLENQVFESTLENFTSHYVWDAATIDWPNRTVTWLGTEPFDCSGNWSSGCKMDVPQYSE